ncbi:MAG: glycosyltransferase family 2 protein [Candidatus Levybacteria bacterium]|nr:glycosyltransferase family 2 protein [Candidatus Levybacteria bacterium]
MTKISGIVVVKNEEDMIADCLDSISFCDEMIVIDGGSEDRTVEIAKKMNAKVFKYISSDFSKIRNFGLKKSTGEWVLYVDADERVSPLLNEEVVKSIGNLENKYDGYFIKRKNFYLGTSDKNEWPYIESLERLFRKDKLEGWYGRLHESPKINGELGHLDGYLLHYTHRDLSSMIEKTIEWSQIEAELRLNSGHPKMTWWRFPRVMLITFLDSYIRQKGWRIGTIGLIESLYQSFSIFITYARLWEMQQGKK